jgi:flagellar hook-length control protein FliK
VTAATPVPLARSAEAVEHVLRLASSRGVTHARIALRPADLGAVDVHIRSTAEGLVARVVAHSAEAVQTLQHAAGDLRRSLEEHGLNLMSLDISQSGESGTGRAGSESDERRAPDGSPAGTDPDESTTETTTLRLPTGVLVDVLA